MLTDVKGLNSGAGVAATVFRVAAVQQQQFTKKLEEQAEEERAKLAAEEQKAQEARSEAQERLLSATEGTAGENNGASPDQPKNGNGAVVDVKA